jgi:uncharacterized protein YndB with AHSA1/START domain
MNTLNKETTIGIEPNSHEITITRDFDAPIDKVFRAHNDPELVAKWVGPKYLENVECTLEPRHGGTWTLVQRDPDGNEHGFRGVIHGDPTPELSQRTFEWLGMPGHVTFETMRMEDLGDGRTRVHASSVFMSVADRDGMASSGMSEGVNEGYERLDELLATL